MIVNGDNDPEAMTQFNKKTTRLQLPPACNAPHNGAGWSAIADGGQVKQLHHKEITSSQNRG
jgi:hypothetical protein